MVRVLLVVLLSFSRITTGPAEVAEAPSTLNLHAVRGIQTNRHSAFVVWAPLGAVFHEQLVKDVFTGMVVLKNSHDAFILLHSLQQV